ncbi:MAG: thiamine pyrophosphate-requiring protein [Sneathiellaceae bacterium]
MGKRKDPAGETALTVDAGGPDGGAPDGGAVMTAATMTAGGALLARLKALGVDYIFANSGTDFPPIIEGLAEAAARDLPLPQALTMPHEHAAMGMAHGYYLATGRPQAVMGHTNVGLANCAIGALNAAVDQVPVLLFSGRTPTVEQGRLGARTVPIGWGQEMRDQAALVREAVKWDYELRFPEQVADILDRALAMAMSQPRGPVYLSLPREVLCAPCPTAGLAAPARIAAPREAAHPDDLAAAAEILARAKRPLIVAQRGAGDAAGFAALGALAAGWAIPVVQYWALRLAVPGDHPMAAGVDPAPWIAEADAILAIDCLAPWWPDIHRPAADCPVIHLGPDPLFARTPVRNFRADIALRGETGETVIALAGAMQRRRKGAAKRIAARRPDTEARCTAARKAARKQARAGNGKPMSKEWVGLCLSEAVAGRHATILSELGAPLAPLDLKTHDSWYQEPHAGGLGWSFPAAMGIQLADPGRLVVATMGDGSYIFANPVACHQIAEALALPVLVLILNNAEWGAVRRAVLGLYPHGHAAKANEMPLTALAPTPDFTQVAKASRAWAKRVDDGAELPAVLAEAIAHIETKRTLALVEVRVAP